MGVDISVWRCRIGTFNASIHRSSGKRVKKSLTLPGGNGVPVVILAAAILLLVVAGEVRYCQRYKHPGSTLLSVPFCAGGSALAHRSRDAVTPAVTVLSKATTQEVIRPLCPVTINFDQIPERGRYAILHPVALSGRETLGFHMTSEPFCQHSSFHLSVLNTHHLQSPPPHFSSSPLLDTPVSTCAIDAITADHQSAHTIALKAGSSYALTIQSSHSTAQGCIGVLDVSVILMLLLLMAGDVELNPGPGKLKTQETRGTSLSTDTDRSRTIVLHVFRRHYSELVKVIAIDPTSVARELYSMGFFSSFALEQTTRNTTDNALDIMRQIDVMFRANPTSPYELMVQFCETIRDVSFNGHSLAEAIMRRLDQELEISEKPSDLVDPDAALNSLGLKVSMYITNIGAHGYPGTGKTSLLDLAMGKDPAETRTSTGCIDPPSRYLVIKSEDSDGVKWELVTPDKMIEMVCGTMKKLLEDSSKDAGKDSETDDGKQEILENILATQTAQDDTNYYFIFSELLEKLRNSKSSGVIFDSHWMMVTDCGGQPPFLDAAALFIRNSCLQIIPIKLDKPLDEKPEFSYYIGGESVSLPLPKVHLTNLEVTETLAKTVSAIQPPYTQSSEGPLKRPKFTIVGTFNDVYEEQCRKGECKESIDQKESVLKEVLEQYKSVQVRGWNDEVILPVNAVTKDEEERKESASKLRQLIYDSGTTMKVDIELWWFGLFLSILKTADKLKKAVLTIDECYKLGKDLFRAELKKHADIESFLDKAKSETRRALQFLHDIGLIMHFDTPALKNVVIVDMEAVLEKVSHLISVPFIRGNLFQKHYKISLPGGMQDLLRQHGRFYRIDLDSFEFSKEITVELFLNILEHVKAVVAINKTPDSAEYFMPCALPYATEEQCVPYSSPPWVIRFRIKRENMKEYIPPPVGYLPALVVFLLTRYPFHFCIDYASRQYRNQFELEYSGGGMVYITERYPRLEIFYTLSNKLPQVCLIIRDCVLNAMSLTEERLRLNKCSCKYKQECVCEGVINKIDSFLCPCGNSEDHHLCTYNHQSKIAVCAKTNTHQHLMPTHLCWLQAGQKSVCGLTQDNEAVQRDLLGATSVTSHQLSTVTAPVSTQQPLTADCVIHSVEELLKELPTIIDPVGFGIHLGVLYDDCKLIAKENVGDINAQVRSIASAWYKGSRDPPTWNKVVKALLEHKLVRDAKLLAKRKGVKLPQSQHFDSDHHDNQ